MIELQVKKLHPNAQLPTKTDGNIGWDLSCVPDEKWQPSNFLSDRGTPELRLYPGETHIFHTGLSIAIPDGYAALLWDRSGLAARNGIHRLAGVIDCSYRGEWLVCLINLGNSSVVFKERDRIVQFILQKEIAATMKEVEELDATSRGAAGFGSSGR